MKPFDANIHIPCQGGTTIDHVEEERTMDFKSLASCFKVYESELKKRLTAANIMVFTDRLSATEIASFVTTVREALPGSTITCLADFRRSDGASRLGELKDAGVSAVTFHSYVQKIDETAFEKVCKLASEACKLRMPILLDTSYGTPAMFRHDNLRLAAAIAETIHDVPIVLLHSGGARALEALLLADSCRNVYLETSFSLPYYLGSSKERDFAFAYKKVGHKVIYGSDFPYVDLDTSMSVTLEFLERWTFSDKQAKRIFTENARQVFQ